MIIAQKTHIRWYISNIRSPDSTRAIRNRKYKLKVHHCCSDYHYHSRYHLNCWICWMQNLAPFMRLSFDHFLMNLFDVAKVFKTRLKFRRTRFVFLALAQFILWLVFTLCKYVEQSLVNLKSSHQMNLVTLPTPAFYCLAKNSFDWWFGATMSCYNESKRTNILFLIWSRESDPTSAANDNWISWNAFESSRKKQFSLRPSLLNFFFFFFLFSEPLNFLFHHYLSLSFQSAAVSEKSCFGMF